MRRTPPRRVPSNEQNLRQFRYVYTVRNANAPEGQPTRVTRTVYGLNRLDADTRLSQLERKKGNQIHAVLNAVAVAKTLNGLERVL